MIIKDILPEFKQPESFIDIFFFSNIPFNDTPVLFDTSTNPQIENYFRQILFVWTQKGDGFRSNAFRSSGKYFMSSSERITFPTAAIKA